MKKLLIFIAGLVSLQQLSIAQALSAEAVKYWYYRDRLQYFVYPSAYEGASVLMTSRNSNGSGGAGLQYNGAEWGQTGKINGYYIGLLATEYRLLKITDNM